MTPRRSLRLTCAAAIGLLILIGCRSATPENPPEMDSLLRSVSYDTTVPPLPPSEKSQATARPSPSIPVTTELTLSERTAAAGKWVRRGLTATADAVVRAVVKGIFNSIFGDDDDDIDESTPQGRADRNFQNWLDARDRWRNGER